MFTVAKEKYASSIKEVSIGTGKNRIVLGGRKAYPFYHFEGEQPNKPKIAMEIWDIDPSGDWPEAVLAPVKAVVSDPVKWAQQCVKEYGADAIVLHLRGTDPNGEDKSPQDAAQLVKKVAEAIGKTPLIVWGTTSVEKDEEVLKEVAEVCKDTPLVLGPVEEANHKGIGAAALGYNHFVVASSPIDVNIAKQTNILLENLGVSLDRIIVDPTTGGLGYGLEYTYSVMERVLQAAMSQGDDKLQNPLVNFLGYEVWKCKEAGQSAADAPTLGDPERRGIMMEAICAVNFLMAGADLLILRHPESVRLVRSYIDLMTDGGSAREMKGVSKLLDSVSIDYAKHAPDPDLEIKEEKKQPAAKKAAPKKAAKPAAPAQSKPKAQPQAAKAPASPQPDHDLTSAAPTCGSSQEQMKAQAEILAEEQAAANAQAALDAQVQAKIAAKQQAEKAQQAKEQAQKDALKAAEAKKQAEKDARKKARQAHEASEARLREERARKAGDHTGKPVVTLAKVRQTVAKEQKDQLQKMVERLDLIHKRSNTG